MCARCHSRRALLSEDYVHGRPLLDTHRPSLLEPDLSFADGQIEGEVYEYGSFLQSRMYAAGVTCSDCHDPHSLKTRRTGNALCAGCHAPKRFDTAAHHFHAKAESPVGCVDCHMTSRRYMQVDVRRDHSFRLPRPDLSVKLGVPNACNGCHADRSPAWAAARVEKWYGPERRPHYAEALHAGRSQALDAEPQLVALAADASRPAMVRATALATLGSIQTAGWLSALEPSLADPDPLIRFGALQAAQSLDLETRARVLPPRLRDPVRSLRAEAARMLAGVPAPVLGPQQAAARDAGLSEYRSMQRLSADRPEAQLNLGLLEAELGRAAESERAYRSALRLEEGFVPAYANLADLYRATGRDAEGEVLLREALRISPGSAAVHHALGLALVRLERRGEALAELARAAELDPDSPRYAYAHAVALQSTGELVRALEILVRAHARHPADREILIALATFSARQGNRLGARAWARKLVALAPEDRSARQLLSDLEASEP
jgi:tetratricopeptide (TPR) repeat protein